MDSTYVAGYTRLKSLPEVMNLNTLSRMMGVSRQMAQTYLTRWKSRGWIEPAGPRAGIYFNLIANSAAAEEHRIVALLMAYPSALLMGESVLHAAGWITQIPAEIQVAVEKRLSYRRIHGFVINPRTIQWFVTAQIIAPDKAKFATYGLRSLTPAYALMDLYCSEGAWHPEINDLDLPDDALPSILKACEAMNCPLPDPLQELVRPLRAKVRARPGRSVK
jgi:hypothetical protein